MKDMKHMDSFEKRRDTLLQELDALRGEGALYGFLMRQGEILAPFAEEWRTEACLLRGCQYRVWLRLELESGLVRIDADSDSRISRGLMALWVRLFSGLRPGEVLAADTDFLHQGVLGGWLIPSRANALGNMASRIKLGVLRLKQELRREARGPVPPSSLPEFSSGPVKQGPLQKMEEPGNSCHDDRKQEREFQQ